MDAPTGPQFVQEAVDRLGRLVEEPCQLLDGSVSWEGASYGDGFVHARGTSFMLDCRAAADRATVHRAILGLRAFIARIHREGLPDGPIVPLLAVPFMGDVGRSLCAEERCSWLDLCGNASIRADGLLIRVEGRPNRFKRRDRAASAFAPTASRVARVILMHPDRPFTQRELARRTGMGEGYVSRIVHNLLEQGLAAKRGKLILVPDRDLLLGAWLDVYDFAKHRRITGHIPARDGGELLRMLAAKLAELPRDPPYAATGLAAAWCMGRFGAFRTVSMYVHEELRPGLLHELSFRPTSKGANVWLLLPNDEGTFHGVSTRDSCHCVTPVQAYLDLHAHAERAKEVAADLKARLIDRADHD